MPGKNTEELKQLLTEKEEEIKNKDAEIKKLKAARLGLYWDKEKEPEKVVIDCQENLPVLARIKDKEIKGSSGEENILIEGDNYHALTCLNYSHKEKLMSSILIRLIIRGIEILSITIDL